jgi:hypothetical protein
MSLISNYLFTNLTLARSVRHDQLCLLLVSMKSRCRLCFLMVFCINFKVAH